MNIWFLPMLRRVRNKKLRGLQVQDLQPVVAYLMGLRVGIVNLDGFPICQVGSYGNRGGKNGHFFSNSPINWLFLL